MNINFLLSQNCKCDQCNDSLFVSKILQEHVTCPTCKGNCEKRYDENDFNFCDDCRVLFKINKNCPHIHNDENNENNMFHVQFIDGFTFYNEKFNGMTIFESYADFLKDYKHNYYINNLICTCHGDNCDNNLKKYYNDVTSEIYKYVNPKKNIQFENSCNYNILRIMSGMGGLNYSENDINWYINL